MRTCGGTERYAHTLYHAGLTSDLADVLRVIARGKAARPPALVGFSMGWQRGPELAGELGESAAGLIRSVCAISTPLDLAASARRSKQPKTGVYQYRFVRRMRSRLYAHRPLPAGPNFAGQRSVTAIDDRITCSQLRLRMPANLNYRTQSAMGTPWNAIRVPTLLLQAKDDPLGSLCRFFKSSRPTGDRAFAGQPGAAVILGFLGKHRTGVFWADETVMEWIRGR